MPEYLNIVDEDDNIIGQETRSEIHRLGLLHREVHIYFITPNKEIIFQHRAKDKDTYPDLLDATVGGHVDLGDDYKPTAVREVEEETGLKINQEDLIFLKNVRNKSLYDPSSNKFNNTWEKIYLYNFKGQLSDLKVEQGKALGFELWPIEKLKKISEEEKKRFVPYIVDFALKNLLDL